MPLIVQKFGGTSIADSQKILSAARKAVRAQQEGHQVVLVVSAMGKNTDLLVSLASEITDRPSAREMDMLLSTGEQVSVALMAMAIQSLGHRAVSLTGAQIGIKTDSTHTKARIKSISTERMRRLLDEGNIVIAAGFQGIDEDFNITTLGRGGSDTTAVALAAVLGASACEIYTDVDGVYTTDPRVLQEARRVDRISYDEMLELASLGAGVMHNRSIEFAKKFHVPIHVRSSLSDAAGSVIAATVVSTAQSVCGAALLKDEARVSLLGVPDVPGTSLEFFSRIAARNVSVDMIVQNVGEAGKADISFTIPSNELRVTLEAVAEAAEITGVDEVTHDERTSKISVVGLGMARQTGVADRMFRALASADVNIQMITTSEIKISVLVERDTAQNALQAVHQVFELEKQPVAMVSEDDSIDDVTPTNAADVVDRLRGVDMEELTIDDVQLDPTQARITISGVPDSPGVAAKVFEDVAAAGIFVDMIVQSYTGHPDGARLSFTVPQQELDESVAVVNRLAKSFNCGGVSSSPSIAKLSVSGVGLRSHTGVAIRMFQALAKANINVEMINTSEVRVNVVVDGRQGDQALVELQAAFADVMR
ncbi:MAG: aspartate kinase [Pirellulaceae bacterium]|nr:aspartate kinase [Pirellulaceae bacterium]